MTGRRFGQRFKRLTSFKHGNRVASGPQAPASVAIPRPPAQRARTPIGARRRASACSRRDHRRRSGATRGRWTHTPRMTGHAPLQCPTGHAVRRHRKIPRALRHGRLQRCARSCCQARSRSRAARRASAVPPHVPPHVPPRDEARAADLAARAGRASAAGERERAIALATHALLVRLAACDGECPEVARSFVQLGDLRCAEGRTAWAAQSYRHAIEILERSGTTADVARARERLASCR